MNPIRQRSLSGFTIIELLVVVAIASLLLGITFLTTGKQQRGAKVRREAEMLAATMRQARSLAMEHRAVYAVVFNIQNAPGSSGAVLNNRSGGHWYRILGPAPAQATTVGGWYHSTSDYQDRIPYAGGSTSFPDFLAEVEESWVGDAHVLPAKQVRFLALGDTDEGPALRGDAANTSGTVYYGSGGETTYPRPWFGYYEEATKTLWPWGGYVAGKPTSGFHYEGADGPITGCVNPVTRAYNHDYNSSYNVSVPNSAFVDVDYNGDGDFDDLREREVNIPILTAGEPRALVNAEWLDAGIAFFPDGRALCLEFNRSRRYYRAVQTVPGNWNSGNYSNGVRDMAKTTLGTPPTNIGNVFTAYTDPPERGVKDISNDIPEVGHFVKHSGGWHITLAPDVLDDRTEFPNVGAALQSITPMYRVFVGANGSISTFYVKQQLGNPSSSPLWPVDPNDWLSTSTVAASNPVWKNCRLGWLHNSDAGSKNHRTLVPRGHPITDIVTPTMLSNKQWWIDD